MHFYCFFGGNVVRVDLSDGENDGNCIKGIMSAVEPISQSVFLEET